MKTRITTIVCVGLFIALAFSAGAAELKQVVIVAFPNDTVRATMTSKIISALAQAGFRDQEQIAITVLHPETKAEAESKIQQIQPDVVVESSHREPLTAGLYGSEIPIFTMQGVEAFADAQGMPTGNISGVDQTLPDLIYNSYKFLQKVAPLKPGQQVVFLEQPQSALIPKAQVIEALQRLNIPLKAVIDATMYEDWQQAILNCNDDPEVGWVLMGVWPSIKRDDSTPNMETETAVWQREHLKKPMVTYWEIAVQWGILCGLALDLDEVGVQLGEMAARVLKGEDIKTIQIQHPRKTVVALNRKTADVMGIIFPQDVLSLANVIFHDWEGKEVTRKSGLK